MSSLRRCSPFPARPAGPGGFIPGRRSRGGFTLVEILVVIAIIAILASVTLPAVTGALKKARENAAMQVARSLELTMFQYAIDNDQTYPGTSTNNNNNNNANGTGSVAIFETLVGGGYLSNTDSLVIPGSNQQKYSGTTPATGLASNNVSWDVTVHSDNTGLNAQDPDTTPVVMSTGGTGYTFGTVGTSAPVTVSISTTATFQTDGVAVGAKDGSAKFWTYNTSQSSCTISSASFSPTYTSGYTVLTPTGGS